MKRLAAFVKYSGLRLLVALALSQLSYTGLAQAAPTVSLTAPGDGWSYNAPITLTLKAAAAVDPADVGATLSRVEFYAGGTLIGSDSTSGYTVIWNAVPLGSHALTAKAIDSLGHETTSAPRTITITDSSSNLLPTVSLTAPANNAKYALPVDIALSASAADIEKNGSITQVEFLSDGVVVASSSTKPYSFTWSNPPAGTHNLTARATDILGGQSLSASRTVIIQGSNTPPTISLGAPTGTYVLPATFTLTANASGGEVNTPVTQVEFLANDQVIATTSTKPYSFAWVNPPPATYVLTARATDNQGLSTVSAPRNLTVAADNTAPTVSLTAPANNSTYILPTNLVLAANAADLEKNGGITLVEFLANGVVVGTTSTKPYSITWNNPAAGSYSLSARATDTNGAQTSSALRTVTISDANAPPKVSLSAPANQATFVSPTAIQLTANASGPEANTPIAQVEFLADGQVLATLTAKPYAFLWQGASVGTHSLTVRATDSLGAVSVSAARTITVTAANQAPTVSLSAPSSGTVVLAPGSITITANASDSDGTIAKVEFYNGATLLATAINAPYSFAWSNIAVGTYAITAKATDDKGLSASSAASVVTVIANQAPTVSLTSPATATTFIAPASVTLSANATDADGTIAKVEFYNGTTLIATATTAPFAATWSNVVPGSYSITAVATDNLGGTTTSLTSTITVLANQAPTVSLTSPTDAANFITPASVTLTANAADNDGTVSKVEFYNGATLIGTATSAPYTATWSNVVAGSYSITAKATDNLNLTTTSAAVTITVVANQAPTVSLSSPTDAANFIAPASVTLTANAADNDGTVSKVEFYNGATLIGTATNAPYTATWNNVVAGSYSITAKATDNLNLTTTSAVVTVTVVANQVPTISLTAPSTGTVIAAPGSISLIASASDADGSITKVEFYNGASLLATATSAPYSYDWSGIPAGSYTITARATDNQNATTTSAPIMLISNSYPTVSIDSLPNNANFIAPANIAITATAADSGGSISKVEFYNGATLISTVTSAPYTYAWNNVAVGIYAVTAIATDNLGAQTTSTPALITVTPKVTKIFYIHADHLGTPRAVTDAANQIVWRNLPTTEPFGNSPPEENPNGLGVFKFNLRFPGQYADRETNLNYNYFRDYDPSTGRYVQSDPIGLAGGVNTYGYVGGNPVSYTDPSGLVLWVGATFGAGTNIALQLAQNGGRVDAINVGEVVVAGVTGFFLPGALGAVGSLVKTGLASELSGAAGGAAIRGISSITGDGGPTGPFTIGHIFGEIRPLTRDDFIFTSGPYPTGPGLLLSCPTKGNK